MNGIKFNGKIGHYYTNKDLKKQYISIVNYSKHKITFRNWKKKALYFQFTCIVIKG